MKYYLLLLVLFTVFITKYFQPTLSKEIELHQTVMEFFKRKNIFLVGAILCREEDSLAFWKNLQKQNHLVLAFSHSSKIQFNSSILLPAMINSKVNKHGVYIDVSCETSKTFIEKAFTFINFIPRCTFLLQSDFKDYILKTVSKIDSDKSNSDIYLMESHQNGTSTLFYVHNIDNIVTVTEVEDYFSNGQYSTVDNFKGRTNLGGKTLRGMIDVIDVFLNKSRDHKNTHLSPLTHYVTVVYGYLQDLYNFRWELNKTDGQYYRESNNNLFIEYDFVISSEKQSMESLMNGSLILAATIVRQCFLFIHPPIFSFPTFYLKPFSRDMWICIAFLVLSTGLLYYVMCFFDIDDIDHNDITLPGSILMSLGTLSNQGLSIESSRTSKRILQFTLLQFDGIMWCFYSAVILNYFLYPTNIVIHDVGNLISDGFMFGKENIHYNSLEEELGSLDSEINGLIKSSDSYTLSNGTDMMRTSKFALFTIDTNVYRLAVEKYNMFEICNLVSVPVHKNYGLAMYVKQNSPLRDIFQRGVLLLKEFGIINKEEKEYRGKLRCTESVEFAGISLHSTIFAYKIYFTGLVLSSIILMIELISRRTLKIKEN